jgi:hypothetical protein
MNASSLSLAQANIDLTLWQIEADLLSSSDLYSWLINSGLPNDVASRLHELISFTQKVGKKVFNIGKIVLIKIIEFVKAHPFLVTGAGIGAVVGSAIAGLITSIPFLGQLLAPIAAGLGLTITLAGAVIGHNLDKKFSSIGGDIFEIISDFFALMIDVFNTVFRHVVID